MGQIDLRQYLPLRTRIRLRYENRIDRCCAWLIDHNHGDAAERIWRALGLWSAQAKAVITMFAIIAAIIFALALILSAAGIHPNDLLAPWTLLFAGLLCLALHAVGVGTGWVRRG